MGSCQKSQRRALPKSNRGLVKGTACAVTLPDGRRLYGFFQVGQSFFVFAEKLYDVL
jgi:hypothetical protein